MKDTTSLFDLSSGFRETLPFTQASPRASQLAKPFVTGHPKMTKLKEVIVEHFNKFKDLSKLSCVLFNMLFRACNHKLINEDFWSNNNKF